MTRKYEKVDRGSKNELIRLVIIQKKCSVKEAADFLGINYENAKTTCRLFLGGKRANRVQVGIDKRKIDHKTIAKTVRNNTMNPTESLSNFTLKDATHSITMNTTCDLDLIKPSFELPVLTGTRDLVKPPKLNEKKGILNL